MKKFLVIILLLAAAAYVALALASWLGPPEYAKTAEAARQALLAAAQAPEPAAYGPEDLAALPEPMRLFLAKAMPASGQRVSQTRLTQEGRIKGTEDGSWDEFTASQVIGSRPPQMAWSAQCDYFPLMPLFIGRTLVGGQAAGDAMMWGVVEALRQRGEVFKAYLMLRWLGEAVWHPDALLPGGGVTWGTEVKQVKEVRQVRAYLEDGGLKVSGVFLFASKGGAPMLFLSDPGHFLELRVDRFYCDYSAWKKAGRFIVPHQMVQGSRRGITDDRRLEIKLVGVEYQ